MALAALALCGCAQTEGDLSSNASDTASVSSSGTVDAASLQCDDGAKIDFDLLTELMGLELSTKLVNEAAQDPGRLWIAAHPDELAVDGPTVQTKLLRLAAEEDEAVAYVRDFAKRYPSDGESENGETQAEAGGQTGADSNASAGTKSDGSGNSDGSTSGASASSDGNSNSDKPDSWPVVVKGVKDVPHLYQWDQRWGYTVYSSTAFGMTGCGPTAYAMAYQGVTGNDDLSPYDMGVMANDMGYMAQYEGTDPSFFVNTAPELGMRCESIPVDKTSLQDAFERGCVVIANVGNGYFSRYSGHFLVLTGFAGDGQLVMNDPYSAAHSQQTWYVDFILNETMGLYALEKAEEPIEEYDYYQF